MWVILEIKPNFFSIYILRWKGMTVLWIRMHLLWRWTLTYLKLMHFIVIKGLMLPRWFVMGVFLLLSVFVWLDRLLFVSIFVFCASLIVDAVFGLLAASMNWLCFAVVTFSFFLKRWLWAHLIPRYLLY